MLFEVGFFLQLWLKHVDQCNNCAFNRKSQFITRINLGCYTFAGNACRQYERIQNANKCVITTISKYFTFAFQFTDAIYCFYCLLIVIEMAFCQVDVYFFGWFKRIENHLNVFWMNINGNAMMLIMWNSITYEASLLKKLRAFAPQEIFKKREKWKEHHVFAMGQYICRISN